MDRGQKEKEQTTRRELLRRAGLLALSGLPENLALGADMRLISPAPTAPVGLAHCETYRLPALTRCLGTLLDRTGGLRRLVAGKTVAVKVNLTGSPGDPALGQSPAVTYQVHPNIVRALVILLDHAGARRIRILEGTYSTAPIQHTLRGAGWDLHALTSMKAPVEFEDTRHRSQGHAYRHVRVPWGGDLFPGYVLNHSYGDCDVYISLAKLKNHATAGVTLSLKNNFGITPTALYGQHRDNENSTSDRENVIHKGHVPPANGAPRELHPDGPRTPSYRVPRHIVDLAGVRPIDLAIIDGIQTMSGGEGPWCTGLALQHPRLLIAGRNAVCTDAIATVCMGYDPRAKAATGPFPGENHLELAARRGLGTNDPSRIEVVGMPLEEARHPFLWEPRKRWT